MRRRRDFSEGDLVQRYGNRRGNTYVANTNLETILNFVPLGFLRAGYYYYSGGGLISRASYGYYWLHRRNSITNAYNLLFFSDYLYPQNNYHRGLGYSLRCLAR